MTKLGIAGGLFAALVLAGCVTDQISLGETAAQLQPKIAMAGRWILSVPNAPPCGMHFGGALGAHHGAIEPEGGCPGNFFTSRGWTFDAGVLTIDDYRGQPLAQLNFARGRFTGRATAGTPVTLARS
jgi:hypothetical protein